MRESADRTAVITDGEIWIRNDSSPRADGDRRWFYVGDVVGLADWVERGCPDKPSFRPPAHPWAYVNHTQPFMGGRRKVEPLDPQLAAGLAPVFDYL